MPRVRQIPIEELELPGDVVADAKQRGKKKERPKPITKTALRKMFETINGAFLLAGHLELALADVELDSLADAWHDVISMYPQIGSMISQGNRLTVWGNALFVTFVILERRRVLLTPNTAGPTRDDRRDDRVGQNNTGAAPDVVTPLRASGGYQT